ncbi:MAG: chemotaxis protein CheA, partial [Candidatus Sericytochromatia bacterium]
MDFAHYLNQFIDESHEAMQQLNDQLLQLERTPSDTELLHAVFRTIHTFKGMASTMGFDDLAELAHGMESLLDGLRAGAIAPEPAIMDMLLQGVEQLERLVAVIGVDDPPPHDIRPLVAIIEEALSRTRVVPAGPLVPDPAPRQEAHAPERPSASEAARTFKVVVTLEPMCLLKSVRAMLIVSSLETLGEVLDITPSLEELEWSDDTRQFEILLKADVGTPEIEASFYNVSEVESVTVAELAPPEARAGELSDDAPALALDDAQRQRLSAGMNVGFQAARIEIALMPGSLMKSVRAAMVMATLQPYGEVVRLDPSMKELEQDSGDRFWLVALSVATPSTLRDAVAAIGEIQAVAVQALTPSMVAQAAAPVAAPTMVPEPVEAPPEEPQSLSGRRVQTLRVGADKLDALLGLVNELAADQARLARLLHERGLDTAPDVDEVVRHLGALATAVQTNVRDLRMVPVEAAFNRFPRMVRNLTRELGKEAELIMEGEDTQLDRLVVDELGDPLMHLLRNALDHGLETPEERLAAGKPATGQIRLAAYQAGTSVVIEVADDGRGIDPARILAKAIIQGLVSPEQAAELSRHQIIDFVFAPGFSTAETVTAVSGRGVGMDVVRNKIASLGGAIEVASELGSGTAFRIRLPLTVALVQAMLTDVGGEVYAIPMGYVEEVFPLGGGHDEPLELVSLRDRLDVPTLGAEGSPSVVVVRTATHRVGLVVEQLLGKHEIAVKPLSRLLGEAGYLTGAAPLDDGRVALI